MDTIQCNSVINTLQKSFSISQKKRIFLQSMSVETRYLIIILHTFSTLLFTYSELMLWLMEVVNDVLASAV